jgi:hypothetical protein
VSLWAAGSSGLSSSRMSPDGKVFDPWLCVVSPIRLCYLLAADHMRVKKMRKLGYPATDDGQCLLTSGEGMATRPLAMVYNMQ